MIRTSYDPDADAFAVSFAPKGATVESAEVAPGIILDFDAAGLVVGVEVLEVAKRMAAQPASETRPAAKARGPTLQQAEEAYLVRFGEGAPVWGFLGNDGLADALLEAVEAGQPWTAEALGERLGVPPSPPGVCL